MLVLNKLNVRSIDHISEYKFVEFNSDSLFQ